MMKPQASGKLAWQGIVIAVQPRIRLTRSFDERSHTYQGYVLKLDGRIGDEERVFLIAVGEGAHEKHQFQIGQEILGLGAPVADPRLEIAELYKVSKLKILNAAEVASSKQSSPWGDLCPKLPIYRERGHRRLAAKTYETKCSTCIWGAKMAVEMIIDQWNPGQRRYRTETFCYGPLSCALYRSGPTRKVPGRRGMSYEEEDWVDEEATSHRGPEE